MIPTIVTSGRMHQLELARRSRVAIDQQLLPSLQGQDYWGRPWTYVGCPAGEWQVFVKVSNGRSDLRMKSLLAANKRMQHQEVEIPSGNVTGSVSDAGRNQVHSQLGSEFTDCSWHSFLCKGRGIPLHTDVTTRHQAITAMNPQSRADTDDKVFADENVSIEFLIRGQRQLLFHLSSPRKSSRKKETASMC